MLLEWHGISFHEETVTCSRVFSVRPSARDLKLKLLLYLAA
jgi:hypothetical protein